MMKCDHCNKAIMRGRCYSFKDRDDGYAEYYCSPECAMKENGIMPVSKRLCTNCKTEIGLQQVYVDGGDDLFCSLACALASNGIKQC